MSESERRAWRIGPYALAAIKLANGHWMLLDPMLWYTDLPAVGHVYDTARGLVDAHNRWLDLPVVYLPAVLLAVLTATFLHADERPRIERS
jgi:hypothetical protein